MRHARYGPPVLTESETVALLRHAHVPAEDWGEAWFVLQRCAEKFDPAKGELSHLFVRAWFLRRIDMNRREKRTVRTLLQSREADADPLNFRHAKENQAPYYDELPAAWSMLKAHERDAVMAVTRADYNRAAAQLGLPLGTFKRRLHDLRKRIKERDAA